MVLLIRVWHMTLPKNEIHWFHIAKISEDWKNSLTHFWKWIATIYWLCWLFWSYCVSFSVLEQNTSHSLKEVVCLALSSQGFHHCPTPLLQACAEAETWQRVRWRKAAHEEQLGARVRWEEPGKKGPRTRNSQVTPPRSLPSTRPMSFLCHLPRTPSNCDPISGFI